VIELHHVGHGAERHQIEQIAQIRRLAVGEGPACAQFGTQGQHDVEHHAAAGDGLARKGAARLVRIDDHIGRRQRVARQVMVGHQHRNAQFVGACHAFDAGDAVVHGDDDVRLGMRREIDDFGRQAVAVLEAVGHQIVHVGAHGAQRPDADGAGGGAVAVVVGHDEQPRIGFDRVGQHHRRVMRAGQLFRRQQGLQRIVDLAAVLHAACGIETRQQRMHALLGQHVTAAQRYLATEYAGHVRSRFKR
jgi:hypothetical protein